MKATFVITDELYRQVKAKSALEGRPIRDVAVELFQSYVSHEEGLRPEHASANDTEPTPSWFGALVSTRPKSMQQPRTGDACHGARHRYRARARAPPQTGRSSREA